MRIFYQTALMILATSCSFWTFLAMEKSDELNQQLLATAGNPSESLDAMHDLIVRGANPNYRDKKLHSPLSAAVVSGLLAKVTYLLDECHAEIDDFARFMAQVQLGHFRKKSPEQQNALEIIMALDTKIHQRSTMPE